MDIIHAAERVFAEGACTPALIPFCNADRRSKVRVRGKTRDEQAEDNIKRVEAYSICMLADSYYQGLNSVQQDSTKAMELYAKSADLGNNRAHNQLGCICYQGGSLKKAKLHFNALAMAGHEVARYILGVMEGNSGNKEQAVKHWRIAASAGDYDAMQSLRLYFEQGHVSRDSIDLTLTAYNKTCT
jgi:TPR repeat protein